MNKDSKKNTPQEGGKKEVKEFSVPLVEFLSGISQKEVESKRAFTSIMAGEGGRKLRAEWTRLYELFKSKPVKTPWPVWLEQNKSKGGN